MKCSIYIISVWLIRVSECIKHSSQSGSYIRRYSWVQLSMFICEWYSNNLLNRRMSIGWSGCTMLFCNQHFGTMYYLSKSNREREGEGGRAREGREGERGEGGRERGREGGEEGEKGRGKGRERERSGRRVCFLVVGWDTDGVDWYWVCCVSVYVRYILYISAL